MDESKLTPWFPPTQDPTRDGVYLRDPDGPWYSYWNGYFWGYLSTSPEAAVIHKNDQTNVPNVPWRGLREEFKNGL